MTGFGYRGGGGVAAVGTYEVTGAFRGADREKSTFLLHFQKAKKGAGAATVLQIICSGFFLVGFFFP